ncbi:MAG TPA: tetratricopeptide repeat protein [Caulobacteraceae bacterium]
MVDVFEEVEEQLRTERYTSWTKRALPWVAGALLLALVIALGIWGYGEWRQRQAQKASQTYAAALEASQADRPRAQRLFTEVSESGAAGYKSLALMQLGNLRISENKPREAVPLYDRAADAASNELIEDAARLKAAFVIMDYAPFTAVETRLRPLTEEGRPYRLVAREALAMAKLQAGRAADARADFVVISQSLDVSDEARARAQAMVAAITSGAAAQVPAILSARPAAAPPSATAPSPAAAALRPAPATTPSAPQ